jgi:hypothetical protein
VFTGPGRLHVQTTSDEALVAKLAFGDICSIIYGQQKVRISIGNRAEENGITVKTGELLKFLHHLSHDQEERQYAFMCFYFAKLLQEKRRWLVVSGLVWVARMLGFVVVGCWLLVVVSGCLVIFLAGMQGYEVLKELYGLCAGMLRVVSGYSDA